MALFMCICMPPFGHVYLHDAFCSARWQRRRSECSHHNQRVRSLARLCVSHCDAPLQLLHKRAPEPVPQENRILPRAAQQVLLLLLLLLVMLVVLVLLLPPSLLHALLSPTF